MPCGIEQAEESIIGPVHGMRRVVRTRAAIASRLAPSRAALKLKRPTGPPASRPTMTATMAAMNPPSDQPKMMTMLCSSRADQPPHIRSVIIATAASPQNMPAAAASRP